MRWARPIMAVVAALNVSAAPVEPEIVRPSSPWGVNYADESCRLSRVFGTGDEAVVLIMDLFAPGTNFRMILAGKRLKTAGTTEEVVIRFGPDEPEQRLGLLLGDFGQKLPAFIVMGLVSLDGAKGAVVGNTIDLPPPIPMDRIAAIKDLSIGRPLRRPIRLRFGSLKAPFAELQKCTDQMLVSWGIDPVVNAALSRPVTAKNRGRWFSNGDYPASAVVRGSQGIVEFRLNVDVLGKPSACHIQQSASPPEFSKAVCDAMMRRAQFEPALDKDGKPVASYYRSSVIFLMGR